MSECFRVSGADAPPVLQAALRVLSRICPRPSLQQSTRPIVTLSPGTEYRKPTVLHCRRRTRASPPNSARFAALVLEATYEATLPAAMISREESGVDRVYLTRLCGGAVGNDAAWIAAAMHRAIQSVETAGLEVRLVSYRTVPPELLEIADEFA